jgi:hypothetical protein
MHILVLSFVSSWRAVPLVWDLHELQTTLYLDLVWDFKIW